MSRRELSDQTGFLNSSAVEKAGMTFANDLLRRSGDGDLLTGIKQSLEKQLYSGLREGIQTILGPESVDPEEEGDLYTKPSDMIGVVQSGVYELKNKYNSIYNQINRPSKNQNSKESSSLFDRITNPLLNSGRIYEEGNLENDINNDGRVDSEEISLALNGDLGEKLNIVQDEEIKIQNDPNPPIDPNPPLGRTPGTTSLGLPTPVNPLLKKKNIPMGYDSGGNPGGNRMYNQGFKPSVESIPEQSIYKQSNQVALVTRGMSGHIQSVNLFNRSYPY